MRLRKLEMKDAEFMLDWMHDSTVVKDLKTDFEAKNLSDCLEFIRSSNEANAFVHLAVVDNNDEYMGTVSLKHIYDNTAEFAIVFRKCAMGLGFSSYGMHEMLEYGKNILKLDTIYWCVDPKNKRAIKFYDKNNYKKFDITQSSLKNMIISIESYSEKEISEFCWYRY